MFPDKIKKVISQGDYVTAEEGIFDPETEIRSRCETVEDLVNKKVLTIPEALEAYELSFEQYFGFLMLNQKKKSIVADTAIFISIIESIFKLMNFTNSKLNTGSKKLVKEMREFATAK